jgi:hypothetical protein
MRIFRRGLPRGNDEEALKILRKPIPQYKE